MYRIFVCDDEIAMLRGIEFTLQENPEYEVLTASDRQSAINMLAAQEFDLVVSDLMMPDNEDGLAVMNAAKSQWYKPSVIAMSAFETVENAVKAMQAGADDFVSKGFGLDELSFRIKNMLNKKERVDQLANENRILRETIQQHYSGFNIIGQSQPMLDLMNRVTKIAEDAQATCFIQGESGTGKELVARSIHAYGKRKDAPFVPINCAAIPENLIESEFFGHEKGAFTGAYTTKQGKFEHARGGIIFLDEIGELPLTLQVRLLRVLEERSFYRIGGKRAIDVDVMILSATNKDLLTLVKDGLFREDLYFRLNVVSINIPPLRERREDVALLAHFFLEKFNKERKKNLRFSEKALNLLNSYEFPGNVRELRNIIEDAFVFCDGTYIQPQNITLRNRVNMASASPTGFDEKPDKDVSQMKHSEAMEMFEKEYFLKLLRENYWNISQASKRAGISREWLGKKVKKLGLKKM